MGDELTPEEVHDAVDRAVAGLLERAGLIEPPVDALALARRHLGLAVQPDGPPRGGARRPATARQSALRAAPTEEQEQWSAARAIGEHLKPDLLSRLGLPAGSTRGLAGVSLPNLFAGRLLVPTAWFAADARALGFDLLELKQRYRTASHEVLAWRMVDLPDACIVTVVDDGRVHRRRGNAWRVRKELSAAERACQRLVHEHGRPHALRQGGWSVQGWPVPRAGGSREILRSVVEDE
jgi:hypothetical protein